MGVMLFEWNPNKDRVNRERHGISFEEVKELFTSDTDFLEIYDEEDRVIAIGPIRAGVVVVVYTERGDDVIRIVSARKATKKEIQLFRQYYGGANE